MGGEITDGGKILQIDALRSRARQVRARGRKSSDHLGLLSDPAGPPGPVLLWLIPPINAPSRRGVFGCSGYLTTVMLPTWFVCLSQFKNKNCTPCSCFVPWIFPWKWYLFFLQQMLGSQSQPHPRLNHHIVWSEVRWEWMMISTTRCGGGTPLKWTMMSCSENS